MKKITKIITILILLGMITSFNVVKAASATVRLTPVQSSGKVGDTISVYFSLQSFQDIAGLMAIGGFLKYDSSVLQYKGISAQNGWYSLSYNKSSGEFLTMQDDVAGKGNIFLVTFTVIGEPASGTTTISVTGIDATDGESDGIRTPSVSTTVKILKTEKPNTEDKEETNTENKKDETNTGNKTEDTNTGNKTENTNKENTTDNKVTTSTEEKDTTSNKDNNVSKNDTEKTNTNKENTSTGNKEQTTIEKEEKESNEKVDTKAQVVEQISKEKVNIQDKVIIAQYYAIQILKWATIGMCVTTLVVALITLKKCIKEEKK